ncbi:TatD family hydrolase [Cyclobacterium xiamenense]|uniref:TatD family hydrolase n=1 Tax=Cyclobacterium xiamenense TaxID=1297121 RepID=UPI0012B89E6D|nr:TatD family hydrolase [Cyclobacterium xiamenense]
MKFIETHAHLYSKKFDSDRYEVIRTAREQGVAKFFMPNIDLESIPGMLQIVADFEEVCFPMLGLHPCDVGADFEQKLDTMEEWWGRHPFVAVGETGIDLYWDKTYFAQQQESLRRHIRWAKDKSLPLVLHCRNSLDETIALLQSEQVDGLSGIFHCFSGDLSQAKQIIAMGFYLGIGGTLTYKNSGLGEVVAALGLDRLVLETDSPYLAPVPFRGKRNSPEYIPHIAEKMAGFVQTSVEEVAAVTSKNALTVFKQPFDEL